jgi:hypothetical protein
LKKSNIKYLGKKGVVIYHTIVKFYSIEKA